MDNIRITLLLLIVVIFKITTVYAAGFDSASFNERKPLEILRITPEGDDVPSGRQIVFQFNQPVVPVGKMEREAQEIPITIEPSLACEWRWLNTSALACQLGDETALKLSTRYNIEVKPGIKTEAQETLAKAVTHSFVTQRPIINSASFITWKAPGMPHIRVKFNQSVTLESVAKHVYLVRPNGQKVTLQVKPIIDGEEDVEVEENSEEASSEESTSEEDSEASDEGSSAEGKDENDTDSVASAKSKPTAWEVFPQKLLPLDTAIRLAVEPGIIPTEGVEKGVEQRDVVTFHTFPEFKFLGIQCTTLAENDVTVAPGEKWTDRCNPLRQVSLLFSSPVIPEVVKENLLITPDLAGERKEYDPWERVNSYSRLSEPHEKNEQYSIWLPELLKAYHLYELKSGTEQFKDEFGRTLQKPIALQFATDHRAPHFVFEHSISVLEKGVDSEVPIFVTNLKEINLAYHLLGDNGWSAEQQKTLKIPQIQDVAFKMPFRMREFLGDKVGVVQGRFTTVPVVNEYDGEKRGIWFFSQITPFYVHAKLGYHNTLIWVTDFATGLPVKDVAISIFRETYQVKDKLSESLTQAVTDANGLAILAGTETLDPTLDVIESVYDWEKPRLFVHCKKGEDTALLPLDYEFHVNMYDIAQGEFYSDLQPKYGHIHTWGTTAQGIYKVGDTMQYKFLVRDQSNQAFVAAPREGYRLEIMDPTGKVVHEVKELSLSEFGSYSGEFAIPKNAAVGWYRFELKSTFSKGTWYPLRVLVSDFTPAPFKVRTTLNGELFHIGDKVRVDTTATLHAGGPYTNAQAKVTALLNQEPFISPKAKGFSFDVYTEDGYDDTVHQSEEEVDEQGQLQTTFTLPDSLPVLYGRLTVESAVRDDRGKDIANSTSVSYVGRDRFVGLKETSWLLEAGKAAQVLMIVVDEKGNPVAETPIEATIERLETKAARVKGAGNAYLTQYTSEWVAAGTCSTTSQAEAVPCHFKPEKAGTYKIVAKVTDTKKRTQQTELHQWATGKDWVVWESSPDNRLDMDAEQEDYKVGETARYLVRNPYPGAQALITVERFGVIKSWVQQLNNSLEIISVPVEPDYLPGFFVSVLVMSPRVDKPIDAEQVDLGKPAFRLGYVRTLVKEPYKELQVKVTSDKPVYKPQESVTLDLQVVSRKEKTDTSEPVELAVAVLDEAVFDLLMQGRDYFDPYKGFYTLDELDVNNYSLVMRLVGRQKFEKKGATPGGDGGMSLGMRSVFKFVSYWNPSIKTDAEGKAQIRFTVPDNLTGWRVLAMAVTPSDQMGLGDINFKVNQPLEIRPALPNQATQGDNFRAGFTVMNRTDKERTLQISIQADGIATVVPCPTGLTNCGTKQTLTAKPYERYPLWLPIKTEKAGTIEFKVQAKDDEEADGLVTTLEVHKRRSLDTAATYGTTVENEVSESIQIPAEIHTDVGGLAVIATPSVIGNVEGAFKYMRDYPYVCWEQRLTKGVMASHFNNLQSYLTDILWEGSDTLPKMTLEKAAEFQATNGGMCFYRAEDQYVSPYLSAYTALAFNWLRGSNQKIPDAVENKLHDYLLTLLRRDVMPDFYSKGMAATVRAAALAALAPHSKITRNDLKRYQSHLNNMDLFGKALFLYATLKVTGTEDLRKQAVNKILAHADQTSGKVSFTETLDDGYKQILSSALRTQCAVLSSLVLYDETVEKSPVGDIPFKLVREITQTRKQEGYWENTQENLFCMQALTDFARVYEKESPKMTVRTWLDETALRTQSGETAQFDDLKDNPIVFDHPMTPEDKGRKAKVKLTREGQGRIYYAVRLSYAPTAEHATAVNSGIEVNREYHVERDGKWVLLTSPMEIKTGELVRVDLYLSLPAPRHFVVVDDPVPGGLEPVNRDLATASQIDAAKAEGTFAGGSFWFHFNDWQEYAASFWSFYHQELLHHAVRFYSDYLPAGNYHLSYIAQAIAPGEFSALATHVEEMYDPEVYGKSVPATLNVKLP